MSNTELWNRFKKYLYYNPSLGLQIDISRMRFKDNFFDEMKPKMLKAFSEMDSLESGVIANPDEGRMVGHYWLRNPSMAPTKEISADIENTLKSIKEFAKKIHSGLILSEKGRPFKNILIIGIGGSALGPQFAASALGQPDSQMVPYFFDNTDPDGMDYVLGVIGGALPETLALVISKSGGTVETTNGMLEAKHAYENKGLNFGKHAVAITGMNSKLYNIAKEGNWIDIFPMWDWVGGRTSETSAVGLMPAALQGLDVDAILKGAGMCDGVSRNKDIMKNPSAILALMWYYATDGHGKRDMVILPYKDRLSLFTKYLQQLIMESLGKEKDLDGNVVNQGITVYGNKGSTDQHAYIQQLRDGVNNFFVTFVDVLKDRQAASMDVDMDFTTGDYLSAFAMGTRTALTGGGRESITITIEKLDAFSFGVLISLYERAVGFYASLININAYHQPGVEAGKKAASAVVSVQRKAFECLRNNSSAEYTAEELAKAIGLSDDVETLYKILIRASVNKDHKIEKTSDAGTGSKFRYAG